MMARLAIEEASVNREATGAIREVLDPHAEPSAGCPGDVDVSAATMDRRSPRGVKPGEFAVPPDEIGDEGRRRGGIVAVLGRPSEGVEKISGPGFEFPAILVEPPPGFGDARGEMHPAADVRFAFEPQPPGSLVELVGGEQAPGDRG